MLQKILVAIEGSPGSDKALDLAIEIALRHEAQLHSICVEEGLPYYSATIGEFEEVKRQKDAFFQKVITDAKDRARRKGIILRTNLLPGHAVETIVNLITEYQYDLLVIGFMGHSRIFERVWGSTSQTLARLAPCSVLVAK
jgi:nucleotide-binding universal stress UspA family protein